MWSPGESAARALLPNFATRRPSKIRFSIMISKTESTGTKFVYLTRNISVCLIEWIILLPDLCAKIICQPEFIRGNVCFKIYNIW